uniref:Uncharacterized protein n=1 Tax=Globodera rostochiensis TaxID=31243 RepID=A0A914HI46_GLORO
MGNVQKSELFVINRQKSAIRCQNGNIAASPTANDHFSNCSAKGEKARRAEEQQRRRLIKEQQRHQVKQLRSTYVN